MLFWAESIQTRITIALRGKETRHTRNSAIYLGVSRMLHAPGKNGARRQIQCALGCRSRNETRRKARSGEPQDDNESARGVERGNCPNRERLLVHIYVKTAALCTVYVCVHIDWYEYMHVCVYIEMCRYIYVRRCIHEYKYIYIHICT